MTALSIRLSPECATVECETCGDSTSVPIEDHGALITEMRSFLQTHGRCTGPQELMAERRP
jgi:hypothetical protein